MKWHLLCFTLLSCIYCFVVSSKPSIDLLVLVPWPDSRPHAGWDAGLSLLPAGRVAVKAINSNPNVLRDYDINIIEAGHEACALTENSLGLINLVDHAVRSKVAAVLGLFCDTTTAALSPIAGHGGTDLIQLSGSYSPVFNKYSHRFPHLWRFVQSASAFADVMIRIMQENEWSRLAIVSNQESVFYSNLATSLVEKVEDENMTTIYHGELKKLIPGFQSQVLSDLVSTQARIVFLAADSAQIASFLCEAYTRRMKYPNYLWVIVDWTLESLVAASRSTCNETELLFVLEGSIYFYFNFAFSAEARAHEDFQELLIAYYVELENVKKDYQELILQTGVSVTPHLRASILFDQVWAFALALNSSLPELMAKNISVTDYGFGHPDVTHIIEDNLMNVSFQGTNRLVQFNDNRELSRPIDLFQIINGTSVLVGDKIYISNYTGKIGFKFSSSLDDKIPEFYQTVNPIVTGVMIVLTVVLLILVTVVLLLILKYRNVQEIKAKSVKVSMLMFLACYIFILGHIVMILLTSVQLSYNAYSALCNMQYFLVFNALVLLFATLYLKLERIHQIFYNKSLQTYSWRYSNWMIALKALGICSLGNVLFIIAVTIKPVDQGFHIDLKPHESISANFKYPYCRVKKLPSYLLVTFHLYLATFMFLNVYLASRARNILKREFKNTKLINIYMMSVFVILSLSIPFNTFFFVNSMYVLYMNVVVFFCTFIIATLSQLMLFLPSVIHVVKADKHAFTLEAL